MRNVVLAFRILPLSWRVQRLLSGAEDIGSILRRVSEFKDRFGLDSDKIGINALRRAVHRAGRVTSLVGAKDSCLSRSLVISAVVFGHRNASMHIGFQPQRAASTEPPAGHAWVTLESTNISDLGDALVRQQGCVVARTIPLHTSEP